MTINLTNTGKRFNRDWIFRKFDYTFLQEKTYAITGTNGSGKSTLLQVLSGGMEISEGKITWYNKDSLVEPESIYKHFTIAAPYLEVIEEMTAIEFLHFHQQFKPFIKGTSLKEILGIIGLEKAANKQIRYFSSGMKQRIKLAQAIFADVPLLLLDEPCTNFDSSGFQLYDHLISNYTKGKTIVVSSNDKNEYAFCEHIISIMDYKSEPVRGAIA
jgi:ABC-type multidrug transport system ATPase subunit